MLEEVRQSPDKEIRTKAAYNPCILFLILSLFTQEAQTCGK